MERLLLNLFNSKLTRIVLVLLVILIGFWLRFWRIDLVPPHLNGDQAAFAYNAYSILATGKDEYGHFLPINFISFGDYKLPVYVYLDVLTIFLFGLTPFAALLPALVLGSLTLVFCFLISQKLFNWQVGIISSLLLAISAWHIQMTRAGFESVVAAFLVTLGVYLFLVGQTRKRFLILAAPVFGLSIYSYYSPRISLLFLFLGIFLIYRQELVKKIRQFWVSGLIFGLLVLPALITIILGITPERFKGAIIFNYWEAPTKFVTLAPNPPNKPEPLEFPEVFFSHNRLDFFLSDVASKLYAYISPANLFVTGDEVGRHGVPTFGVLYLFEFPLILAAGYFAIKKRRDKAVFVVIVWMIAMILPAALTRDKLHSVRSFGATVPVDIFEGWGVWLFFRNIFQKNLRIGLAILAISVLVIFYIFLKYLYSYYVILPAERAEDWQYGYKQAAESVVKIQDNFSQVIVDSPVLYGNPYIHFLFYQKYPPDKFQKEVFRWPPAETGVIGVGSFGKYTFRQIYWPADRALEKTLFVGTTESLPEKDIVNTAEAKLIDEIKLPNGKVIMRIVAKN